MPRLDFVLGAAVLVGVVSPISAQGWQQAIATRWPGAAICKVSDQDFESFAKTQALPPKGGHQEFVRQQLLAYGLVPPLRLPVQGAVSALHPRARCFTESVRGEAEPNNTLGQANALPVGDHMEAAINAAGDVDWYSFTLTAPGHVFASVNPGPDGVVLDSVMTLNDSAGNLLAYNDDENRSWLSSLDLDVPAGTYYLMVRGYGAADIGNYSLDVTNGPAGAGMPRLNEAPEPNGPIGTGTPTVLSPNSVALGNTAGNGDVDWYTFTLPTRAQIRAETGPGLSGAANPDTIMYLWDQTGTNQLAMDDDAAPGAYSLISIALPAGTYHLDVQGFGGTNAGSYTLMLQTSDLSAAFAEAPEPNGNPQNSGTPSVFACGNWAEGDLNPGGDDDWWVFGMNTDGFLVLDGFGGAITPNGGPIIDSIVRLYDVNSNMISMDDDGGPNFYPRLTAWLPAGLYYLEMRGFGTATGSYSMHLSCNANAQYVVRFGGCPGSGLVVPELYVRPYEVPLAGSTFVAELRAGPANGAALGLLGLSRTLARGTVPLPFDLLPLGAPGCLLEVDPMVLQVLLANSLGEAVWALSMPSQPALLGLVFHQQLMTLDAGANALGVATSNSGTGIIHRRP